MLRNYFKIAWRSLMRNKAFSAINILGLSVGLTCCMLITLYIWHECSYDSYHPNIERLYQVGTVEVTKDKEIRFQGCPNTLAGLFQNYFLQVEATARICPLLGDDKTLIQYNASNSEMRSFNEEKGFAADSGFFKLFKYDFVEGNPATAINGPYSIVLSKDIADKLFNGNSALNKTIRVSSRFNGDHDYTVTGVFKPMNLPSHIDGRFFVSMYGGNIGDLIRTFTSTTSNYFFITYVRLRQGVSVSQVESRLPEFVNRYEGKDLKMAGYNRKRFLINVKDIHLHANMDYGDVTPSGSVTYLYILGSIAAFTLLIACINFMNLSTARSSKRASEVGIRKTLGAGKTTLVRQFLGESILMSFIAFVIAIMLAILALPAFEQFTGKTIKLSGAQWMIIGSAFFALTVFTGLIAGSYPAFYLSSFRPVQVLKGKITNSLSVVSLRKALVVFQFSISIVLIVAAAIISKQMSYLRNADLGFQKDQQIIIPLRSYEARQKYAPLKDALSKNNSVSSIGASFSYPGLVGWNGLYYAEGKESTDNTMFHINMVDFDFQKTLQLQAVAGHLFSDQFPRDSVDGIVLNEEAIRKLGYTKENAVGRNIYSATGDHAIYRIVGVVKDFHFEDLHVPIASIGFLVNSNPVYNYIIVHITPGNFDETIRSFQKTWKQINPNEPFEYSFMDEQFQKHYEADNRLANMVKYATGLAIFISCLGLLGLATFSAEQRTKEIGIRKVLGASSANIVMLLSGNFFKLVLLAVVIGSPLGWWATHKWLQNFAYRTTVSWGIFLFATIAILLLSFLTIATQAFRAAMANPARSLKAE